MKFDHSFSYRALLLSVAVTAVATVMTSSAALAQAAAPAAAATQASSPFPVLDRAKLDALFAQPDKVVFLDVRRADEISSIGGFPVYLNIQASELDRFLSYLPKDRQIVTVSNHAGRAKATAALLAEKGFQIAGVAGVQDYEKEGGTLYGKKVVTPDIPGVVKEGTRVEVVREGFEGTEGPVALKDGSILFTENRADRIVQIAPNGKVSTYLEKTGGANALAIGADNALVAVQTAPSGIAVLKPTAKIIAKSYAGKPLNRPNDLAVSKTGNIYFSDPGAGGGQGAQANATPPTPALYWTNPTGKVTLITNDIKRPNGVALSPDDKTLYVANTAGDALIAFTVQPDGSVTGRRDFARLAGIETTPNGTSSGADGIVVDKDGRVYVATNIGVQVFSPAGAALGVIPLPKKPQNLAFGGKDHAALYAVGRGSVFRVATLTAGVDRPGK